MMHFYGIDQKVWFVMIPLGMKFDSTQYKSGLCWAPQYQNSKVTLGSLMGHSSKFTNLGMMWPTRFSSMGARTFTQ
jgi:hypothetical protein